MNINYDEIITRANTRKDKLMEITKDLVDFQYRRTELYKALSYFATLGEKAGRLDPEGRALLGDELTSRLVSVGSVTRSFWAQCENEPTAGNHYYTSLLAVVQKLEAHDD